jgi:hypothetical protein
MVQAIDYGTGSAITWTGSRLQSLENNKMSGLGGYYMVGMGGMPLSGASTVLGTSISYPGTGTGGIGGNGAGNPSVDPLTERVQSLETDVLDLFNTLKDMQEENSSLRAELEQLKAAFNQAVQRQSRCVGYWEES